MVKEVVEYLNKCLGSSYSPTAKTTVKFIQARINEGFKLEDFKAVILHKSRQWKGDEKMEAYLRPQTLFGTKFESYLQQAGTIGNKPEWTEEKYEEMLNFFK